MSIQLPLAGAFVSTPKAAQNGSASAGSRDSVRADVATERPLADAPHDRAASSARLNQLRAGVLGANDGIVSVAGMVVGVAAATPHFTALAVAGVAALSAGALSMAMGEYVSVSTQRDTEFSMLERARERLAKDPEGELEALADALEETGIPEDLARQAAQRMSEHDALDAHARVRFGVEEDGIASPLGAALASLMAFFIGGLLPLIAVLVVPLPFKIPATVLAVVLGLALTGLVSAKLGQAKAGRATIRTILGGSAAMAVTYVIGALLGVSVL